MDARATNLFFTDWLEYFYKLLHVEAKASKRVNKKIATSYGQFFSTGHTIGQPNFRTILYQHLMKLLLSFSG